MSKELDEKTRPFSLTSQKLQDRVAETLNLMHDFTPIEPTKRGIDTAIKNESLPEDKKIEYKVENERDISMLTNIPQNLAIVIAHSKALDIAEPCLARTAFTEQLQRSASSVKGWRIEKAIEGMKAVRPISEQEQEKGRFGRFMDMVKGK